MGSNYKIAYNVDITFVIDATGSMDHILDMVKKNALNFFQDVSDCMATEGKHINQLRVRVVEFRDYLADDKNAMRTTDFFCLPQQAEIFRSALMQIIAFGGGDDPEDGLEALAYAIKSPWCTSGTKRRHVIVVWTDESTHELGFGKKSPYYPDGMARNLDELTEWWNGNADRIQLSQQAKRLLLFAPDLPGWSQISERWDNVIHIPSEAGKGLREFEYNQIIATIANSV